MKVTKFRGQVNDQTFDNVQDYNKAITEAIEKNNLKSASSNTWVEEFEEISKSERPTPTSANGVMERLKATFEFYVDQFNHGINEDNVNSFINKLKDILKTSLDNNDPNHQMYVDYIDDELEKLTQSLDEFCEKMELYSNKLYELDNQIENKEYTYTKLGEEINALKKEQQEMNSNIENYNKTLNDWVQIEGLMMDLIDMYSKQPEKETPIEPQKEFQKPSWMSSNHFNFLKEIFG
jgi:chromosome segregation ATPase